MQREKIKVALLYRGPQNECRDEFTSFVPVGLFYILKSLLIAGYNASLHNLSNLTLAGTGERLSQLNSDAIFISSFFGSHHEAFMLARKTSKILPKTVVVLGGPLSVLGEQILRRIPEINFVICGEGEEAAIALLDALFFTHDPLEQISGLVYRSGSSIRSILPVRLDDIDRYFFCPSELIPYCHGVDGVNFAVLVSSRGCPYSCKFCSSSALWRNKVRYHSVELLVAYLRDLRQATGATYFSLRDENFLVNRGHVHKFAKELVQAKLHYLWNAQGSAHLIDESMAALLAMAGCDQVQIGIETIDERLQTLLGKRNDPEQVFSAISVLRRHAIRPFGYFIYGMGETDSEAKAATKYIMTCGVIDAVASPLAIYPGAGLAERFDLSIFFAKGEVVFYSNKSVRLHKARYEKALAAVASRQGFSRDELFGSEGAETCIRIIAKHFFHFGRADLAAAQAELRKLIKLQPDNPWGYSLLARFFEQTGQGDKADAFACKALTLTGHLKKSKA